MEVGLIKVHKKGVIMRFTFPVVFVKESLGYSISFPDFEGVFSEGDTFEESLDMAAEALEITILHYIGKEMQLPKPSDVANAMYLSVDVDTQNALVPTNAAAEMLGISSSRVRQMVSTGQLVSKRQGRDNYIYLWSIQRRLEAPRQIGRPRKVSI